MPTPEQLAADAEAEIVLGVTVPGLAELASQMYACKQRLDELESQEKALRKEYDELRKVRVPATLHKAGVTSARFLFGTLSLRHKTYPRAAMGRMAEFRTWCITRGFPELLAVNMKALQEYVNDLIEDGQPVPGFIAMYTEEMAVLTESKGVKSDEEEHSSRHGRRGQGTRERGTATAVG